MVPHPESAAITTKAKPAITSDFIRFLQILAGPAAAIHFFPNNRPPGCTDATLGYDLGTVKPFILSPLLLVASNVFMTFAWYGHLRNFSSKPWLVAALGSWLIAGLEYLFMIPANRIGITVMTLPQLKIMQEAITLTVFIPFAVLYMNAPLKMDFVYAALCILGAVYFIFRG